MAFVFFVNPMYYTTEEAYLGNAKLMQMAYVKQVDKLPMNLSLWEEATNATIEDQTYERNRVIKGFAKELETDKRIDYLIQCYSFGITIHTLIGSTYYNMPMVTKEQTRLICDYMGVELIEGFYPEKPGDIVMDERMAKNCNIQKGDTLYGDAIRVCGIVASKSYFAVGIELDELVMKNNFIFLNKDKIPDLKQFFLEYGWEASEKNLSQIIIIYDQANSVKAVEEFKKETDQPLGVMVYAITIVMGITLYFVYQLHIKDRYEEWCLYRSLGYSEREVFGLAMREYGICMIGSALLAVLFLLPIFYFGGAMMSNKGIVYRMWLPDTFKQLTAIIIFLTGILQIPVIQAMQHITTIDAIEDDI